MFDIKAHIEKVFKSKIKAFSERIKTCEIRFDVEKENFPSYNNLLSFFNRINYGNAIKIEIINPDDNLLIVSNIATKNETEYNEYLSDSEEDDVFEVSVNIQKKVLNNCFVVYNYSSFTKDFLDNSLFEIMHIISLLLNNKDYLIFYVLDENVFWSTKSLMVTNNSKSCFSETLSRQKRIEDCKLSAFFQSSIELALLPDDFDIVNNVKDNPFQENFNKIKTILSLCYISSNSTINHEHIWCTINGQRSIKFECSLNDVYSNNVLYYIFDWIFTEGNYVDKAIIARNIISLNCKYTSLLDIDTTTFISVVTNYGLYLKENVSKYLEAKTKVSEFISDFGVKISGSAFELLNDFKKNILAVFSFFLTVVLVNIVSEHPLENLFTKEIKTILELILLGSLAYYFISLIQTISNYKKIKNNYLSLQKNYEGVFSLEEMNDIFDQDNIFVINKKIVIRNIILFSIIWIAFIVVSFVIIESMSTNLIVSSSVKDITDCVNTIGIE